MGNSSFRFVHPEDMPFALSNQMERSRRYQLLASDHMRPLAAMVKRIKDELGDDYHIPEFDPCDGGVHARVLFLLEAPGPKAVASGFISRNNPDYTAKNMCEMLCDAGIPRDRIILWNIVPWYVGTGDKIRPVDQKDIAHARKYLSELFNLLNDLQAVILVGKKAQSAKADIQKYTEAAIFNTDHPSPRVFNIWPEKRQRTLDTFLTVAKLIR